MASKTGKFLNVSNFTCLLANLIGLYHPILHNNRMGCAQCVPLPEPIWFSYYGPIRQPEAADAVNAAISDHLQEIGAVSTIPIRRVVASKLRVPVAFNTPMISSFTDDTVTFSFATSSPGRITLQTANSSESYQFEAGMALSQLFKRPDSIEWIVKFDFEASSGVTCRLFTISAHNLSSPTITDDKLVIDGVISTVSRVFRQDTSSSTEQTEERGFNDGMCLICCSEQATVVTFPCRHCCMCRECSERFATMSTHCPVCRATVTELIECVTEDSPSPNQTE